ncbi:MAG: MBL fold metallo-hydrolase, partial [Chloroflexi bacterium]|nr:MBL fold metallo-hydrolase [Chloroflexota bacterium]
STRATYGNGFEAVYGPILPVPETQVRAPADGEIFPLDGRQLQVIYAPGHAPHHIAVFDHRTGGIFCGEALGMPTDVPLPAAAAPSFDLDDTLRTMERALALGPRVLFYSHGNTYSNARERIAQVTQNTISFGNLILESMKEGHPTETIGHMIRQRSSAHFPPNWEDEMVRVWLTGILNGYTLYFTNKGLA